jgi:GNAT superfamily N-acetyltransferase
MLEFRRLARGEIERIWTIDRREFIKNIYRLEAGELRLEQHNFDVQGWPPDTLAMMPLLHESFDRGGEFFGAFDAGALVGVTTLDTRWRGPGRNLLQLEFMHVSRDYRGKGVGTRLFEQAREAARARGARGLYISATPSENTIRFYQGRGSVLIDVPDPELYEREPEDIHLECPV